MRWLFLSLALCAFTPIFQKHDSTEKIDEEFANLEQDAQSQGFRIFNATPTLKDLKDGQIVIMSTNGYTSLMWRSNIEIFSVKGSCVTIFR